MPPKRKTTKRKAPKRASARTLARRRGAGVLRKIAHGVAAGLGGLAAGALTMGIGQMMHQDHINAAIKDRWRQGLKNERIRRDREREHQNEFGF